MKSFRREPCSRIVLVVLLLLAVAGAAAAPATAQTGFTAAAQREAARRFLEHRSLPGMRGPGTSRAGSEAVARMLAEARAARARGLPAGGHPQTVPAGRARAQTAANLNTTWAPIGPQQTLTAAFGAVTGRVTSIAVDPADASGNTVYLGTTGGGVWKSANAAAPAAQVLFAPVTDNASAAAGSVASLASYPATSIGAVSVQPGNTGVVLAGTGDPNDALDSYYGSGILRSTDNGATWTTVTDANVGVYPGSSFSFYGNGFAGFAWSTATPGLVVAAVTEAFDGLVVNAQQSNSVEGLYYSIDAGATWLMATLTDGANRVFESNTSTTTNIQGNAVTSVVWNPFRQAFFAAIRYHGYYTSPGLDQNGGMTWTRLPDASQPGAALATSLCPAFAPGAVSCPVFRGALAVQPATGDMFAFTVDRNLADQGIWQDVCAANGGTCSTAVTFGTQISDAALEDGGGHIVQGDYDLWLAAVPANADTLLYAGTVDVWKRSLAAPNVPWRNTTSSIGCATAQVAPSQHAVASGANGSLMFFGNDGGLWRTTDAIGESPPDCSAGDAAHFDNLNSGLGSLAEISSLAQARGSNATLLAGQGGNGTAGTTSAGVANAQGAWPLVLDGLGAYAAIDPATPANWYMSSGPGVSISYCGSGGGCAPSSFSALPTIGEAQTASDGLSMGLPAVWMLDPQDSGKMLVGTCRVWRGAAATGAGWSAVSQVLGDSREPDCTLGEGQIQSLGASGTVAGSNGGEEVLYAGMEGSVTGGYGVPYGGLVAGHIFTATVTAGQSTAAAWTDVTASANVVNDQSDQGQFNPGGFGVSAVVADTHDPTGKTVYATIQGFGSTVYRSADRGQTWTNITANLPAVPVNALVVDPGDANIVYVATDVGVYVTMAVATCSIGAHQCWSPYGTGMPGAPVTSLQTHGADNDSLLLAGTNGRGVWEMLLAGACNRAMGLSSAQLGGVAGLVFGNEPIGGSASQLVTVTNSGSVLLCMTSASVTGGFTEQDTCTGNALVAGASCSVTVQFAPSAAMTYNGTLTLTGNVAGGSVTAAVSGTGVPSPVVLSPAQLTFDPTQVGSSAPIQYVTLSNSGSASLSAVSAAITPTDYTMQSSSDCAGSLAPQTSCTVGIVFSPTVAGMDNGTLTMTTSLGTFTAQLIGTGVAAASDAVSPTSLSFSSQTVGTASAAQSVTLSNSGGEPLTLITAISSTTDYVVNATQCATGVPAGGSCSIAVSFAPQTPGASNATMVIADSLHPGTAGLTVTLTGTGVAPAGIASVSSLASFGMQGVGSTSAPQSVTLTNNGTAAIAGLSFVASGDFMAAAGTCGTALEAGAACVAAVTFTPSTTGSRTGSLSVYGTNLTQTLTTGLAGVGVSFTVSPVGQTTRTVVTGTTANYQVSLVATGSGYPAGAIGAVALACTLPTNMPAGSACTLNPAASAQLVSGASTTVSVAVTTPALAVSGLLPPSPWRPPWPMDGWLLAISLPLFKRYRLRSFAATMAALLIISAGLAGCGAKVTGGGSSTGATGTTGNGVPPVSYAVTVTASAPGIQQSTQMTLLLER